MFKVINKVINKVVNKVISLGGDGWWVIVVVVGLRVKRVLLDNYLYIRSEHPCWNCVHSRRRVPYQAYDAHTA
jgi:hypothetical protein